MAREEGALSLRRQIHKNLRYYIKPPKSLTIHLEPSPSKRSGPPNETRNHPRLIGASEFSCGCSRDDVARRSSSTSTQRLRKLFASEARPGPFQVRRLGQKQFDIFSCHEQTLNCGELFCFFPSAGQDGSCCLRIQHHDGRTTAFRLGAFPHVLLHNVFNLTCWSVPADFDPPVQFAPFVISHCRVAAHA